jgi:hypothetical protein
MSKRKYTHATPREFVKAWQESSYVREVARKVGSTKGACCRRAYRYRQMGVPLKCMWDVPVEGTDWEKLAEYARELAPEDPDTFGDDEATTEVADTPQGVPSDAATA